MFSQFLSTSPLRGTTDNTRNKSCNQNISIHVPLAGDDRWRARTASTSPVFLSTSPLRGTTDIAGQRFVYRQLFLSTSPLRGTTDEYKTLEEILAISIHVPLAGDDAQAAAQIVQDNISIHVPLAGDDTACLAAERDVLIFLSTSPLRGTTRRGRQL